MSIPGAASPLFLATTGAAGDFEISRSLRFNSADSAYLNRTPSSASNRKTWTWSGWVKRSSNTQTALFHAGSSNQTILWFDGNHLEWTYYAGGYGARLRSTALFRDFSAWMHVVFVLDTSQATANSRMRMYVNGVELTDFAARTNPSQNADYNVNNTVAHQIGRNNVAGGYNFNGSLAEINFVDGAALDPTSFGETDDNGVWQAKDTSGLTFGTNGFRLKFADNSSNAALGTDSSGNSNTWTVNNLTAAAVTNPTAQQNFNVATWTGNSSSRDIATTLAPDFVWIKSRSHTTNHVLYDAVRGPTKVLYADVTADEATQSTQLTAFNSNSFSLGAGNEVNQTGRTYVAWYWKAGGAASSNSNGTITSSVSANASYGFSICTYTGNGTGGATIGHSLGSAPSFIIVKDRGADASWHCQHSAIGNTSAIFLNSTSGAVSNGAYWNNTSPTNSVFTVGTADGMNGIDNTYVAYCWSEIVGFSKFGSYTGSGSSGNTITTGFKPRFVLVKRTTNISGSHMGWSIVDSERGSTQKLQAQNIAIENDGPINAASPNDDVTFNDDGFTLASGGGASNASGETYIYAAFAATISDAPGVDSLVDTPGNGTASSGGDPGGSIVGNYCTWNRLGTSTYTLANGNLDASFSGGTTNLVFGTIGVTSGKWYWEIQPTSSVYGMFGIVDLGVAESLMNYAQAGGLYLDQLSGTLYGQLGGSFSGASYASAIAVNDIVGVALDMDNGNVTFYKNGVSLGVANTSTLVGKTIAAGYGNAGAATATSVNFGQRAFAHPVSGYKSLNTANLTPPTIADGSKYFDTKLYSGTGSAQSITGLAFGPDFVWTKRRSSGGSHGFFDIVRGATKWIGSNSTTSEQPYSDALTSFDSNGFSVGADSAWGGLNVINTTNVAWAWDGGTSTATNNNGSIASQVRAQPSAGFSICTYPGNGTGGATVGHGLNDAPALIISKSLNVTNGESGNWFVNHSYDYSKWMRLNLTNRDQSISASGGGTVAAPTSSVFSTYVLDGSNVSSNNYVAYCFAPVAGYSSMGSYVGNGNASGPLVFTGFRSAFILIKASSIAGEDWVILDTSRAPSNVSDLLIKPNTAEQEFTSSAYNTDILSNGFKIRNSNPRFNQSGATYIYYAVSENPFQANGGLAR